MKPSRINMQVQPPKTSALRAAFYRALESAREDALFRDPLAQIFIEKNQKSENFHPAWSLSIRTYVIDRFIQDLVSQGIDTVVNLGAGLDTRPYRMFLPPHLTWIEVDLAHMIDYKEKQLANQKARCRVERIRLDIRDEKKRGLLLSVLAERSTNILVLTEGVLPYMSEEEVASLAKDLHIRENFQFWITEYFAKETYPLLKSRKGSAPFRFLPENWFAFFNRHGWIPGDIKYLAEESEKLHRAVPAPWWSRLLKPLLDKKTSEESQRFMGYVIFCRNPSELPLQ